MQSEEKEKQEALLEDYRWTVSHASKDDWGKLEAAPTSSSKMCGGDWFGWCTISSGEAKKSADVDNKMFWSNYDISKSVSPTLLPPEQYKAAKTIARAIRARAWRKATEERKFKKDRTIAYREIVKIQSALRRYDAPRLLQNVRDRVNRERREQRAYDSFRNQLLGKGYRLMRWSHSQKKPVPCVVRVDRTREYFLFEQGVISRKRYPIQEVKGVTKGYQSTFLKEYVVPKEPDKHLSIYFLDPKGKEEKVSVDLVFDAFDKNKQDKDVGGDSDGRQLRNRFYINFCKLQQELESDDAFFFNEKGAYCRVGRSVFERWERVTMIDPSWNGTDQEQLRMRSQKEKRERKHLAQQHASKKRVPGAFYPFPLARDEKPQAGDSNGVVNVIYASPGSTSSRHSSYAATWYSWTEEIDYGNNAEHLAKKFSKSSWAFRNPMLKEKFVLQRCVKKPGTTDFVPQFYPSMRKKKKKKAQLYGGDAGEKPVPARLMDMKPYFEEALKKIYGDIGIAGWRNSETSEFEFEDADWRRLCAIAKKVSFNKVAKKVAIVLEEAMDEEAEARKRDLRNSDGARSDNDEEIDTAAAATNGPSTRDLTPHRRNLLRHMWREKDQCKDRMWHVADITYNTAQKNKLIAERRKEEQEAIEEKRLADKRRREALASQGSAFASGNTAYDSERMSSSPTRLSDERDSREQQQQDIVQSETKDDEHPVVQPQARVLPESHFRDGHKIDLAVLETSVKRKKHVPLGLKVGRLELRDYPLILRGKKRDVRIKCKAALVVQSITDDAAPSISHAWQNQILAKRDLIVSLNGKSPGSCDDLIQLTKLSRKPRSITIFRLANSKVQTQQQSGGAEHEDDEFLRKLHKCLHDPNNPLAEI